ncbi:MAG: crossover junction endodeoxyribonuclease RuvC [Fusobacteria bacterium]|nr:crossover junction endodeoxyribonuclease RuvC [Fusobacteriota bacterium]
MRIIGIDPGTAICGYSVLDYIGNKFTLLDYGVVTTPANSDLEKRLYTIYQELKELIEEHQPQFLAVEELFFNTNAKTALSVGHARGVILLLGAMMGLEVFSYTPLQVKQSVVGYGRAEKKQIQEMVKLILNMEKIPKPDDAADAIAVAICHGHSYKLNRNIKEMR